MKNKYQFRSQAKGHCKVARSHLDSGEDDLLFSAALRLRMAFECIAYELLQSLGDDVSQDVMKTWQPGKLIKELKNINPNIDQSVSIRLGGKEKDTKNKVVKHLGTDTRLSARWISKEYNALGGFLHVPTMQQNAEGKNIDFSKLRERVEGGLSEVDRVLESQIYAVNIRETLTIECECGFDIKRRISSIEKRSTRNLRKL